MPSKLRHPSIKKKNPCSPWELLVIARQIRPDCPQEAFEEALHQVRLAESYLDDPMLFAAFGDRILHHVEKEPKVFVNFSGNPAEPQDQFVKFLRRLKIQTPGRRKTCEGYCLEWVAIETEGYASRHGGSSEGMRPLFHDTTRTQSLPQAHALRLALYFKVRQGRSTSEARENYLRYCNNAEEHIRENPGSR